MAFEEHRSPARVAAEAAARLPRWLLLGLVLVYGFAGLPGHDPWFQDDAASFGVMWTMARGHAMDWWLPNVFGAFMSEEGPLPFWVGALVIKLLGPLLGDTIAARLTCLLWLGVATSALWYAMYRLARRDEAQPVAFAFGGEANAIDYGRMMADIGVLLFIGTAGILLRLHQTTAENAAVAFVAVIVFGFTLALDRPRAGAWTIGLALGGLALSRSVVPALFALPGLWIAALLVFSGPQRWRIPLLATVVASAMFALWPIGALQLYPERATDYFAAWRTWCVDLVGLPGTVDVGRIARNLPWYAWPLWPLALWTLYAWRHALAAPHIAIGAVLWLAMFAHLVLSSAPGESMLLLTIPPLVPLAAFGATTLRRQAQNALDFFSIALFTLLALGGWAYFFAMMTGTPRAMAYSIARLLPGYAEPQSVLAAGAAGAVFVAWLVLALWRLRRRPPMLWRGPMLAAAGMTMLWVLANLLYLPEVNYSRSYAGIARQVAEQIDKTGGSPCVFAHRLRPAHRALFALHGGLRFVRPDQEAECQVALHRDARSSSLDDDPPPGPWQLVWEGSWPTRQDETFRLYRRGRN